MPTTPVARRGWAGPDGRALFCRWAVPPGGRARAGVLLVPPVGVEAQAVRRAYRELARALATAGLAALQVDLYGTGDSAPAEGALQGWQASVREGAAVLRQAGAARVDVVAMRLGATVAASVAAELDLGSLVLWDPLDSGRTYLREQQLLMAVYAQDNGCGPEALALDEGAQVLGTAFSAGEAEALLALRLQDAPGRLAGRSLVLERSGRPLRAGARARLEAEGARWAMVEGQERLLSVWPLVPQLPEAVLAQVVGWLGEAAPEEARALAPVYRERASFAAPGARPSPGSPGPGSPAPDSPAQGDRVEEQVLALGPTGLFGVLATPAGRARPAVTAVLLNSGLVDHAGPANLWTEMSRRLASQGVAALRVDLSGLGDSPGRAGVKTDVVYSPRALDDVAEVLACLPGGPGSAVLVGLCSGAWHALEAARRTAVRGVAAVNPFFPVDRRHRVDDDGTVHLAPEVPAETGRAGALGAALGRLAGPARQALPPGARQAARRVADAKWWLLARSGRRARPAVDLRQAVRRGADVLVACRPYEAGLISRGERGALARLSRGGRFRLAVFPGTDHTLFLAASRAQVVPQLEAQVLACAGRAGTGGAGR